MAMRSWAPAALVALVFGVAGGVLAERHALIPRGALAPVVSQDTGHFGHQATFRGLLADLLKDSAVFVLTGVEAAGSRCNPGVRAMAVHEDYMQVRQGNGPEWSLPFSAIYRVDRTGPGPIEVPIVYLTAFPYTHLCGD